jgi:hypothetical protein
MNKIKIISCINDHYWYKPLVGQIIGCVGYFTYGDLATIVESTIGNAHVTENELTKEQLVLVTQGWGRQTVNGYVDQRDFETMDKVRDNKISDILHEN